MSVNKRRGWRRVLRAGLGALVLAAAAGRGGAAPAPSAAAWEPAQDLREAAERFVRGRLPQPAPQVRIEVQGPPAGLHFARCAQLQVQDFGNANPYGQQTVQVRCSAPQQWSVYLPVAVHWPQQTLVAARALVPGQVLREQDLSVVQRDRASLPAGALEALPQAEGRVLRYGVAAGQVLSADMLAGPQLVHPGQAVSLVAQFDGVRLVAAGVAMQGGHQGQTVLARNLQSGKVVNGVIDGAGQIVTMSAP